MPDNDPYAAIAKPIENADPYAAIAKPVSDTASSGQPTVGQQAWGRFKDQMTGAAEGAANTTGNLVSGTARLINKIPYVGETLAPEQGIKALEARTEERSKPANEDESLGRTGEQIAEWMIPTGAEEKAGAMAAEHLPQIARFIRPAAKIATGAVEGALRNASQGGDLATGAVIGGGGSTLNEAGRAIAPKIAEKAIGLRGSAKRFGATPGQAVLDETHAVFPGAIAEEAGKKSGQLTNELNSKAAASNASATVHPAVQVLDDAINKFTGRHAGSVVGKLQDVRQQLTQDLLGFPTPAHITPHNVLELKRGVGDLIGSWTREEKKGVQAILPKVYRALDAELDRTVPGAEGLNQRISSLIPAANAARRTAEGGKTLSGLARHTLFPTIGGALGYESGGRQGAIAGTLGGIALNSPTAQVAGARLLRSPALWRLGRGVTSQVVKPTQ
jgi:hypothetical protein